MSLIFTTSCTKKNNTAEIVHNCTGDYVIIRKFRYRIVNYETTLDIADGTKVKLEYTLGKPSEPFDEPFYLCEMAYDFQDYITIIQIK